MTYSEVAAAYDAFADDYDEWVGEHVSARRAKAALLTRVRRLAPPGSRVLDMGCGTGSEAVTLARAGYEVTGVDLAPRMLEHAALKCANAGVRVRLVQGAAGRPEPAWEGPFDLAYAAYGVLNLEPDPNAALAALGRVVRPGGHVILGTLNPTVLYELALFPLGLRMKGYRKAFRGSVTLKLGHGREEGAACRLPRNHHFEARGLRLVEEVGLHVIWPPPSEGLVRRLPRLVAAINRIERRLESRRPFARLGYFSLLTFRKEDAT